MLTLSAVLCSYLSELSTAAASSWNLEAIKKIFAMNKSWEKSRHQPSFVGSLKLLVCCNVVTMWTFRFSSAPKKNILQLLYTSLLILYCLPLSCAGPAADDDDNHAFARNITYKRVRDSTRKWNGKENNEIMELLAVVNVERTKSRQ